MAAKHNITYLHPQSVLEKSIHFQTLDLTKFLMCSAGLSIVTISDTRHIKTIFSFSPGTGKHFIGNALCSSDGYRATHSHFAHLHYKRCLLQTPGKKIQRTQIWRTRGEEGTRLTSCVCACKMTFTFSLLGPNIVLCTLFSDTPNL